jgi:uncharacterized protein YkwD
MGSSLVPRFAVAVATSRRAIRTALVVGSSLLGVSSARADEAPKAQESGASDRATLVAELRGACGAGDVALDRIAEALARRKLRAEPALDLPGLTLALRAERLPWVWPRSWVAQQSSGDTRALARAFASFREKTTGAHLTCGVSVVSTPAGALVASVIVVDVEGTLTPVRERSRVGEWLTVEGKLAGDVRDARVMIKGPYGAPRTVPGAYSPATRTVRATFAPDARGVFTVQVVGDTSDGPRPLLETLVFADTTPSYAAPVDTSAPTSTPSGSEADALAGLVNGARREEGLAEARRDARLDAIALAHVRQMIAQKKLGHDVGRGDPRARVEEAGLRASVVGENVATGREIRELHRALTDSPSHHANVRRADFDRLGVAAVRDAEGALWGCELFAGGLK